MLEISIFIRIILLISDQKFEKKCKTVKDIFISENYTKVGQILGDLSKCVVNPLETLLIDDSRQKKLLSIKNTIK